MTKTKNELIHIRNGVDPHYLVNALTKDVTVLESIFDIVDNALDAARNRLWSENSTGLDSYGLPSSYRGNKIDINFGKTHISFLDNCGGVSEEDLVDRAFVIGEMSQHEFGIGRFGIGMKRTLFRLGDTYKMETDTGTFAAKMAFNDSALGNSDVDLMATRIPSGGKPKTMFRIEGLRPGVGRELNSETWENRLRGELSRRYGIFLEKGFRILVNGKAISNFGPGFRKDMIIKPMSDRIVIGKGIVAYVDSGLHEEFLFTDESGYSSKKAKELSDQYGWYFVCNDRIVEVATHEKIKGWRSTWHQEYYGFVGWVKFVAQDPGDLPWDTKKTLIDPHSLAFREISDRLQAFAEEFKRSKKILIKSDPVAAAAAAAAVVGAAAQAASNPSTTTKPNSNTKPHSNSGGRKPSANDHNEYWPMVLPPDVPVVEHRKLKALVFEATTLPIEMCYSGSMLFRAIMEMALMEHLKMTKSFRFVKQMVFDEAAVKDPDRIFTEEQKKKFRPTFSQALQWLNRNDDYFPEEVCTDCIYARNKFSKHLKELNGIVHDGDLSNSGKLATIRDETMPLLQFLLTGI